MLFKSNVKNSVLCALIGVGLALGGAPGGAATAAGGPVYLPLVLRGAPAPPSVFGIHFDFGPGAQTTRGFDKLVESGGDWTRLQPGLRWARIEPNEGDRNWSAEADLETQLRYFSDRNINVMLVVNMAPVWAQRVTNQYCGPVRPNKYAAMANFFRDAVARYTAPPFNIRHFEFWNEPDADFKTDGLVNQSLFGCWGNKSDPYYNGREYGAALKEAYRGVKLGNPQAQLFVGGLLMDCAPSFSGNPACATTGRFLEGLLLTAGGSFDGVSFHAYDAWPPNSAAGRYENPNWGVAWNTTGPGVIAKSRFIRQHLAAAGLSGKTLINTETGVIKWGASATVTSEPNFDLTKTYYVPQTYAASIAEGIAGNIWFDMFGWFGSGLLRGDDTLVPAYDAMKVGRQRLNAVKYIGEITSADVGATKVAGYKFNRGDRKVWVVWSKDGATHNATFATAPLEVVDALGAAQSTGTSIPITIKPLYIEWP